MSKEDLIALENVMINEVLKRRALGNFDANAATILVLCETVYKLTGQLIEITSHLAGQKKDKKAKRK